MDNFHKLITPEEAVELHIRYGDGVQKKPVEYYQRLAKKRKRCIVCGQPAWRLADTDLCFACTTGENDASDDYELIQL